MTGIAMYLLVIDISLLGIDLCLVSLMFSWCYQCVLVGIDVWLVGISVSLMGAAIWFVGIYLHLLSLICALLVLVCV